MKVKAAVIGMGIGEKHWKAIDGFWDQRKNM